MSCRQGVGGCGYQFCWLCREEYRPGHFRNSCPMYGGTPDFKDVDLFEGSRLMLLKVPLVLLSGVPAGEVFFLPMVGVSKMMWLSALGLAGFVCLHLHMRRRSRYRRLCIVLAGPIISVALMLGWVEVQLELGEAFAAVAAMLALEVTGLLMDRRPVPGHHTVLKFFFRRVLFFVLAILCVSTAMATLWAAAQLNSPDYCPKASTLACVAVEAVRAALWLLLATLLMAAVAGGGMALHPGLPETCSPTSWWLGAAGFARLIALAALPTTFLSSLDNFYQTGGWGLFSAATLVAVGTTGRCALAAISQRRSSWPLPWLAMVGAWASRLVLEVLVHLQRRPPALLCSALAMAAQLLAGALAGALMIASCAQQPPAGIPNAAAPAGAAQRAANRRRQPPQQPAGKRLLAAAIGMIAGFALSAMRLEIHSLFALRLAACGIFTAAASGCFVQQLPFVKDLSATFAEAGSS